jgi:hypothetical protein
MIPQGKGDLAMSRSISGRFRADVRRTSVYLVLASLGLGAAMTGCAERANSTPVVVSPTSLLPTPPQQHAPWTPPTGLPETLVAATGTLFDEGMADPRGGEYRTITVQYGDPRLPDAGRVTAHGWVLPTAAGTGGQRFAVCWNGLVYPVVSVGDPADLASDVRALVEGGGMNSPFASEDTSDWNSLKETTPSPLKVCYLMRLGEGDLARQLYAAQIAPQTALMKRLHMPVPPPGAGIRKDPYLPLATVWTSSLADRAVRTHRSGADALSLADLQELTALQPMIEAEAARRGSTEGAGGGVHTVGQPYFGFLKTVPRLMADETRRVAGPQSHPALAQIMAMPDKTARIAALIQALDQVSVQQQENPGGVEPDGDPIVAALIDQGDDAVQPLIDTVKNDQRLTRSVSWGHGLQPGTPVSVAGAAFAALVDILHTSKFSAAPDDMYDRAKAAAALQAYWDRYKGLPLTERWYRMLADDTAGQAQWLEAAKEIVRPQGERVRGGWIEAAPRTTGTPLLSGEALRHGHTPSVAALMARRVYSLDVFAAANGNSSIQVNDAADAHTMALCLALWDPQAARNLP